MSNEKNFFVLGSDKFSRHIKKCLKEDGLDIDINNVLPKYCLDTVIIPISYLDIVNGFNIDIVLKRDIKKIILIENGPEIYLNSKNSLPFSVYTQIIPKNDICKKFLDIEKKIIESRKQYVIFRTSEIYGISMPDSLINKLLFLSSAELENSTRDFIYDGDVINAIEIALRKEVIGLFDVAFGQSIDLKNLVELIKKIRKTDINIIWKRKKTNVSFNCDNFKYYKWEPLIDLELGIKTLLTFWRNYGISSASNSK
jgi:hypothetical protein